MSRHHARKQALSLLYQLAIRPENEKEQCQRFVEEYPIGPEDDALYFNRLIDGILEHQEEIRSIISKYLRGWTLDRQEIIDVAILSIGVFELLFDDEVPTEIAISEAVILADTFGTDQSRPFVNAVLGNVDRFEKKRVSQSGEAYYTDVRQRSEEVHE